jgi:diguanylate cyclase (GGDEF)-like protein
MGGFALIKKYFESASRTLRETYGIDVVDDILLGRKNRVVLYADVSNPDSVILHVIFGNLTLLGFRDSESIPFSALMSSFDFHNKYAEVAGKQEYFTQETDVTFPIISGGRRKWLRCIVFPVETHSGINVFSITDVTELLNGEELIYEKTHKDSLTNLFNKYTFDYHYGLRYRFPDLHVLFLDLDDFKVVNDTNGHPAGDHCLQVFSDVLQSFQHDYDLFYRLGGDEFVGLLFGTPEYVKAVAQEIIDETQKICLPNAEMKISVSIGIVKAVQADDLIRKADEILYRVKKAGKNRFIYEIENQMTQ